MFETLEKKIHDIRQQPEHVRLRYMWGALAVSMILIIIIWIMSIRINIAVLRNNDRSQATIESFQQHMQQNMNEPTQRIQQQDSNVSISDLLSQPDTLSQ